MEEDSPASQYADGMKIVVLTHGPFEEHGNQGGDPVVREVFFKSCCWEMRQNLDGLSGYEVRAGISGGEPTLIHKNSPRALSLRYCPHCGKIVEQLTFHS